jgi:hypothetical protein
MSNLIAASAACESKDLIILLEKGLTWGLLLTLVPDCRPNGAIP